MANWTDLSTAFGYGTKLTSSQMQQLRDNITAAFEKASGAPVLADDYVVAAMMADSSIDSAAKFVAGVVNQTAIGANAVGQSELKTSSQEQQSTAAMNLSFSSVGQFGLFPQIKHAGGGSSSAQLASGLSSTTYATTVYFNPSSGTTYITIPYVSASGEVHWIFILKRNGKTIAMSQAPDHPRYGSPGTDHPFLDYDPLTDEIIVVNPSMEDVERILARMIPSMDGGYMTRKKSADGMEQDYSRPYRSWLDVFNEMFDIDEANESIWPNIPITVDLPKIHNGKIVHDWRFMPHFEYDPETKLMRPLKVKPVQMVIEKADNIRPLKYKPKQ